jgi:hypothetical protein
MQEYLHNVRHNFFATTTTRHYANSTLGKQQQANMKTHTLEGRKQ